LRNCSIEMQRPSLIRSDFINLNGPGLSYYDRVEGTGDYCQPTGDFRGGVEPLIWCGDWSCHWADPDLPERHWCARDLLTKLHTHVVRSTLGEIHRFIPVDATPGIRSTLKTIEKDTHDTVWDLLHDDIKRVLTENGVDVGETVRRVWDMVVDKNEGFQDLRTGIDKVNWLRASIETRRMGGRDRGEIWEDPAREAHLDDVAQLLTEHDAMAALCQDALDLTVAMTVHCVASRESLTVMADGDVFKETCRM